MSEFVSGWRHFWLYLDMAPLAMAGFLAGVVVMKIVVDAIVWFGKWAVTQ